MSTPRNVTEQDIERQSQWGKCLLEALLEQMQNAKIECCAPPVYSPQAIFRFHGAEYAVLVLDGEEDAVSNVSAAGNSIMAYLRAHERIIQHLARQYEVYHQIAASMSVKTHPDAQTVRLHAEALCGFIARLECVPNLVPPTVAAEETT
jgi:hypothetical protein